MLAPTPASPNMQKAFLLAGLVLVGLLGFAWRKWLVGPESLQEKDRAVAMQDERRERIQQSRKRPEWQKRVEAWWRLGEQKRISGERR